MVALNALTDTWNNAPTTFNAIEMDVTATAYAAASRILNLKVGGTTVFDIDVNGYVLTGEWRSTDVAVAYGGTGASTAADARTNLGLVIGTNVQAYQAPLTDFGGLSGSQGDVIYFDGANWVNLGAGTSGQFLKTQGSGANPIWATNAAGDLLAANNLSDVSNAATARVNLGLEIGVDVQGVDQALTDIAGLSLSQGDVLYVDGGGNIQNIAAGTSGQIFSTQGAGSNPQWITATGIGDLLAANNLSDVDSTSNAATNLGLGAADSPTFAAATLSGVNGLDVNPGSDTDADLITVGVTGSPKFWWDESSDSFEITTGLIVGDPGSEGGGITVGGVMFQAVFKVSDIGGSNAALNIIHRHSTTLPAVLLGSRSKSDTSSHTAVADNDPLFSIYGAGQDGTDYELAGLIEIAVDGTVATDQMPGEINFYTNEGSQTLTKQMAIRATGAVEMVKTLFLDERASALGDTDGKGQIWVKNTSPNELWFTNDDGTDVQLGTGTGDMLISTYDAAAVSEQLLGLTASQSPTNKTFDATNSLAVAVISGATYSTVQHMQDVFHSAGTFSGGGITDDADGTITVAAGTGAIRATDSGVAQILFTDWDAEAGANVALADNDMNYLYVEYNAGAPQLVARTAASTDFNTDVFLGTVYRAGTDLHLTPNTKHFVGDHASQMLLRMKGTAPFAQESGGILSEIGTRNITVTAGVWWSGLVTFTTATINTSGAGRFTYYYDSDGAGTFTAVTAQAVIDNTQYNNPAGGLATLNNNKYGVHWVYVAQDGAYYVVYGLGDYSLANAEDAGAPATLPPHFAESHARIIGKIIIQKSASAFTLLESAFDATFSGSVPTDHNALAALQGGTTDEYYHLTAAQHTVVGNTSGANTGDEVAASLTVAGVIEIASDAEVKAGTDGDRAVSPANLKPLEPLIIACSDETTALTTGTAKVTFRMPYAFTLKAGAAGVRASVNTAPTDAAITIDINKSGASILSTKLTIAAASKTSVGGTAPVLSSTSLADDEEITIDIDQIGSTVAGAGLKVTLIGNRT